MFEKNINEKEFGSKQVLDIHFNGDIIEIDIQKDCTFEEYISSINQYKNYIFEIPVRMLITEGLDFLTTKIKKQKILIVHHKYTYFVVMNNEQIRILERKIVDFLIYETVININKLNKQYSICKCVKDFYHSTKLYKFYSSKDFNIPEHFTLDKKEALSLVNDLIYNLQKVEYIDKIICIEDIYEIFNLASKFYVPIINDNIITLSLTYGSKDFNINKETFAFFHIILNETKEKIGVINFCYGDNGGFTYDGNVGYRIKKEFQNKGYATRALRLLRELLKNNQFDGDKDLYIATIPENECSKKVAINNDGELVYRGKVPEDEMINVLDGIEEVFVYRIKV